jgi:hypothetical protein
VRQNVEWCIDAFSGLQFQEPPRISGLASIFRVWRKIFVGGPPGTCWPRKTKMGKEKE